MYYTVYRIKNKINNKEYIGKHQTEDLEDGYMGSGKLIQRAIQKYDVKNFSKEILHIYDTEEEMNAKEKELVTEEYCSWSNTYNLCPGGRGGFGYINKNGLISSNESRKKGYLSAKSFMTDSDKNMRAGDKSKELGVGIHDPKNRFDWTGKKHREESRQKISIAMTGKYNGANNPSYGKCWITNNIENKMIKKEELDNWLCKGYRKGRILDR